MDRSCTRFVIASVLSLVVLLGLAWAANVEEELKKLETDRAAAAVKGDAATLEKQTSDDYTFINLYGQMSDKSQMVNAFKTGQTKLTSDELSDMKVRVYGSTAVITGKAGRKRYQRPNHVHPGLCEERRQLAIRRLPTNSCLKSLKVYGPRAPVLSV
jgi:hypothetical protein